MTRILTVTAVALASTLSVNAFTVSQVAKPLHVPTAIFMSDDDDPTSGERGVSIDQDGKSNVWAIEPKVEVESKSNEEKFSSYFIAVGGIGVFGVLAAVALTNLPDPNQF